MIYIYNRRNYCGVPL